MTRPFTIAVILTFIILSALNAPRPLHLDNMDFPAAAAKTAVSGVPIYYRGELRPAASGLYHPPLYIYLLAGWILAFGSSESAVRMFGAACALLQGLVVLEIVRTLYGRRGRRRFAPIFWALFLLHPYTIQTAGICDIDSTIYGPLVCFAVLAALRISWNDGLWRTDAPVVWEYGLISLGIFLCLWAKLTTVLLVLPFVFLFLLSRLGAARSAVVTAAVVLFGIVGFMGSYWLYGQATGMDVRYTYGFLWGSFAHRGSTPHANLSVLVTDHLRNLQVMVGFMLAWTGALPWLATTAAIAITSRDAIARRDRRSLHTALILILALLSTIYYCAQVQTFGFAPFKYVFVYWGIISAAPAFVVARLGWNTVSLPSQVRSKLPLACVAVAAVSAAWALAAVRDSLMLSGFQGGYRWVAYVPALLLCAGFGLIRYRPAALTVSAAAVAIYCGLQFGIAFYQTRADYSTTYDYGQTGFGDTVAFLRSNTLPEDRIVSMKDIGFRSGRRYFESYSALYGKEQSRDDLKNAISSGQVAYAVFTEERGQDQLAVNPALQSWILANCELVRSLGHYRIFRPKVARPSSVPESINPPAAQLRSEF